MPGQVPGFHTRTEQRQSSASRQGGGRVDVVRMLDMGADVALITVQVEIVTGIDCASKCYTSHSSFYPFIFLFFGGKKSSEHNADAKL